MAHTLERINFGNHSFVMPAPYTPPSEILLLLRLEKLSNPQELDRVVVGGIRLTHELAIDLYDKNNATVAEDLTSPPAASEIEIHAVGSLATTAHAPFRDAFRTFIDSGFKLYANVPESLRPPVVSGGVRRLQVVRQAWEATWDGHGYRSMNVYQDELLRARLLLAPEAEFLETLSLVAGLDGLVALDAIESGCVRLGPGLLVPRPMPPELTADIIEPLLGHSARRVREHAMLLIGRMREG